MDPFRHIGRRHLHLDATDSTNSRAAELAHDPAYAGTVVTADLQTRGRGQHGRVWESPPGRQRPALGAAASRHRPCGGRSS